MARIDGMIDTLVLDEASLPQVGDDAPKFVKDFMAFLGNLSSNPDKEFDYAKFASTANKFLYVDHGMKAEQNAIKDADGKIYGGAKNVGSYLKNGAPELGQVLAMLSQDRAKFNATVMPLIEWLYRQQIPHDSMRFLREDLNNMPADVFGGNGKESLERAIPVIKDMENVPTDSPAYEDACRELAFGLKYLIDHFADRLSKVMDPTPRTENKAGLNGVKKSYGRPIYEVCGEVVAAKLENFSGFAKLLGTFIRDFSDRREAVSVQIRENMRYAGRLDRRRAFARETLERENDALEENLRLTTAKRKVLMRQMESFAWPFDGAWTETHVKGPQDAVKKVKFALPAEKQAVFLEALAVNLGNLKTALGFAEGEDLPPEIARLALTYFAQIDPRAALAVKSLDENAYNAFLVGIEQREDAALLGSAVAALRNAPDDAQLIAAQPNAAEEFAAIDRKADKIELTPWGVLKLFKEVVFGDD